MNTLTIRPQNQSNTTTIENHFIDVFMPKANGEFVKIYLYLIRIMNDPSSASTLSTIADVLEHTEKDLLRGLSYWEKAGLLNISWDEHQNISAIDIVPASTVPTVEKAPQMSILPANSVVASFPEEPNPAITSVLPSLENFSATCISTVTSALAKTAPVQPTTVTPAAKSNEEFRQVLHIAQCYLEKPLSKSETDSIQYFYDELDFSLELIDHLIEYCVGNGHKSMHYINTVAHAWAKEGITTVEAAQKQVHRYNQSYKIILRAFGIVGREPIETEIQYMNKWMNDYQFTFEMINAACEKTITTANKPSFQYADAIITRWYKANAKSLADIDKLDAEYTNAKSIAPKPRAQVSREKVRPASFAQQNYDFDTINSKLFNVQ